MPISIPSSIFGISVPGLPVHGPLAKIYARHDTTKEIFNYPRNLVNDATRLHYINFSIWKPTPTNNEKATEVQIKGSSVGADGKPTTDIFFEKAKSFLRADVVRSPLTEINLYIPDTVNVQYNQQYNQIDLANSLGKAYYIAQGGVSIYDKYQSSKGDIGKLINAVGSDPFAIEGGAKLTQGFLNRYGAGVSNLDELALRSQGFAYNPQVQVLFKGVDLRTFQFDFTLTPYSKEEAKQIQEIIKAFKLAAAPEIIPGAIRGTQGLFFNTPDPIEIHFMFGSKENENVHKIGRCVLTNVNVDYAPMGWATFDDGNPVQTKLTLQFQEVVVIDKTKINSGY